MFSNIFFFVLRFFAVLLYITLCSADFNILYPLKIRHNDVFLGYAGESSIQKNKNKKQ